MVRLHQILVLAAVAVVLAAPSFAETTGNLSTNNSMRNITIVTGLSGNTVMYCNSDSDCLGYKCFVDYDSFSADGKTGWCNATYITSCYHVNATSYGTTVTANTGSTQCVSNTTYRSCASGTWSGVTSCSSGQTCSGNSTSPCSAPSTTTSSSPPSSFPSSSSTNATALISLTLNTTSLSIVQGNSDLILATIKNTGTKALANISLSVSGVSSSWFSIYSASGTVLSSGNSKTYNITFSIPASADVNIYTVVVSVTTNESTAKNSSTVTISVKPTANVSSAINQTYYEYIPVVETLRNNLTDIISGNATADDIQELESILGSIETKMGQAKTYLNQSDYFNAKLVLDQVKNLVSDFNSRLANVTYIEIAAEEPAAETPLWVYIIIIAIVGAIVAVVLFFFWPRKGAEQRLFK